MINYFNCTAPRRDRNWDRTKRMRGIPLYSILLHTVMRMKVDFVERSIRNLTDIPVKI